jgi:DNA (cytosine-5)-methyltransferase 1
LAEATCRRIARGIRKYVIDAADPFIVQYHSAKREGDDRVRSVDEPLPTQTTENRFGLVSTHITKFRTGSIGSSIDSPVHTITAGSKENPAGNSHAMGIVSAFLARHFGESIGGPVDAPAPTVMANGMGKTSLVAGFLAKHYTGVTGSKLDEPAHTVTSVDHNALVAAHLVNTANSKTTGRGPNAWPMEEPMRTVTASPGFAVASSHLAKMYGTTTGQDQRSPMATVTSGGNHIGEVRAFLTKYYGDGGQDQSCHDPMHTVPTKDRFALVTVAGVQYAISDIGMRMLAPRELYAAQGFPANYIINPPEFPLTKTAQVRMCGNSVCPPLASALVSANVPELKQLKAAV